MNFTSDFSSISVVAFVAVVVFSAGVLAVPSARASDVFLKYEAPGSLSAKAYGTWAAMRKAAVQKDERGGLAEPVEEVASAHRQSSVIGGIGYQHQVSAKVFEAQSTQPMRASR